MRAGLGGVMLVLLWAIGQAGAGEPGLPLDTIPPPVYVVVDPVPGALATPVEPVGQAVPTSVPVTPSPVDLVGTVNTGATRGTAVQVAETVPAPERQPIDGDCESWRPLLERYGIPYDEARPIMWRESRCSMAVNYNPRTRDDSLCAFQLNRWGKLDAAWDSAGFSRVYMMTPEGCIAAVAFYYEPCGWGPWIKPYDCPGGWPL